MANAEYADGNYGDDMASQRHTYENSKSIVVIFVIL